MVVNETVAVPRPDEMCDPAAVDCNCTPRYKIDVMSQLAELTVKTNELAEPASTTMLLPVCVTPKAKRRG